MWRCRNSAVANRRALQSDYTSATEKTPTPLNGRCTRPQNRALLRADTACATTSTHDANARMRTRNDRRKFSTRQKPLCNHVFAHIAKSNFGFARAMKIAFDAQRATRANRDAVSVLPRSKKFFHRQHLRRHCAEVDSIKNERIGCQVIRIAVAHATPRVARHVRTTSISECARRKLFAATPRSRSATRALRQSPSLLFSRSLTACGLALPPEAFIT